MSHQEMIKGVRIGGTGKTLAFFDTLEVPIIENTADEEDLTEGMAAVRFFRHVKADGVTYLSDIMLIRLWRSFLERLPYWSDDTVSTSGVSAGCSRWANNYHARIR